jgi:hypothetical protein
VVECSCHQSRWCNIIAEIDNVVVDIDVIGYIDIDIDIDIEIGDSTFDIDVIYISV